MRLAAGLRRFSGFFFRLLLALGIVG